jgi:hypothetical protein
VGRHSTGHHTGKDSEGQEEEHGEELLEHLSDLRLFLLSPPLLLLLLSSSLLLLMKVLLLGARRHTEKHEVKEVLR